MKGQTKELYTTSAELTQKIVTSSLHKQIDRIFNPQWKLSCNNCYKNQ